MYRYIIKRVLLVIPTLLGAAALVFVLMRLIPGDVCVVRLGSSGGTFDPKAVALCHTELGMDRPVFIQVMQEDYIRTARAKGLIQKLIVNRHALKNALLPVVTLIGIEFAFLIGGLVVTEQVFNLNGVGRLFVQAVQNQDYTLSQALVMLTVMVFVICNLIVDLFYAWLDPRIRFS